MIGVNRMMTIMTMTMRVVAAVKRNDVAWSCEHDEIAVTDGFAGLANDGYRCYPLPLLHHPPHPHH